MRQFYIDLANWIESINQKSAELSEHEYWQYIFHSADKLMEKYNNHELVKKVVNVHVIYLGSLIDDGLPF